MATAMSLQLPRATAGAEARKSFTSLPFSSAQCRLNHSRNRCSISNSRIEMSSSASEAHAPLPVIPENRVVLGCGLVCVDFLATVACYPEPDEKIRSTSLTVQGGGNVGNALTCLARLGLSPRIITKIADDSQGKAILEELENDGVDTSFVVVSEGGNSPFSYIIVDTETKTRTCIHTPGDPPMIPADLSQSNLFSALDGVSVVYFDGRLHETASLIGWEAKCRGIPILVDAEKIIREGLDNLLNLSSYVVCSAKFPQEWTGGQSVPSALVLMLLRLPNVKFVVVTLGEDGCVMVERTETQDVWSEEVDVDKLLETLKQEKGTNPSGPACISSGAVKLQVKGVGSVTGKLLVGTAEKIPRSELIDTTGAGDAFVGGVLYGLCADMPPEIFLPFATQVAAISCRALGARKGLPYRTDQRLVPFLVESSQEVATFSS